MEKKNTKAAFMRKDLKNIGIPICLTAVYLALTTALFGEACPLYLATGVPCPACGLTRAGLLVLTGQFVQAFQMHAFIYAWIILGGYFVWNRYIRQRPMPAAALLAVMVVLMLLYYGYRMAVYFPDREPLVWSEHAAMIDVREMLTWLRER